MAGDWKKGDLALCVSKELYPRVNWLLTLWTVQVGGVYIVAGSWLDRNGRLHLELEDDPTKFNGVGGWSPSWFRKIRPHTPDAEDAETIRLLTGAPVRVEA